MASKVYFTDMRCEPGRNLQQKLEKLIRRAGITEIDMDHQMVAIKAHFGEPGNLAFLRPNFSKTVADVIKSEGGVPFLTDCNTLYVGRRKNALEHLDAAFENGFSPLSTGCQIIIADGLKGTDDVEVPVEGGEYVKTAKIGRAIMDADVIISLNHFKGHELAGFGGAIKNLGMGCGSRAGKMEQHNSGKPTVDPSVCRGCRKCARYCAQSAIGFVDGKACIDHNKCAGCGRCIGICAFDAIQPSEDSAEHDLCCKMAEYSKAVIYGRPSFHITVVMDVSPYCDCHGENDAPLIQDVGMFASFDPVALDQACFDAVHARMPLPGTMLTDNHPDGNYGNDYFHGVFDNTNGIDMVIHAEKIGLGSREYELITIN